jgi:hypothetical protein
MYSHTRSPKLVSLGRAMRQIVTLFAMFAGSFTAFAQTSATVTGRITDQNGSAVVKAAAELTNIKTNTTVKVSTNGDGYFQFPPEEPGPYIMHVHSDTFADYTVTNVVLEVGGTRSIDVVLRPAEATQAVTVQASAPELVVDQADRGNVVESEFVQNLPLNLRNPFQLVNITQGVTPYSIGSGTDETSAVLVSSYRINGGKLFTNENLLDGAINAINALNAVTVTPTVDAVQEFKVLTTAYQPEYGHTSGAVISFATKSGGNAYHGSVWEYLRNSVLDANGFNANAARQAKPHFERNQFGYALGGPVVIPRLYDGHNKTFFYSTYEGLRQSQAGSFTGTVPTSLERVGDFSQTRDTNGNLIVIYDPRTTRLDPTAPPGSIQYIRDPFPGNKILQNLDTTGMNILKAYPLPNQAGQGASSVNNFFSNSPSSTSLNNVHLRIDHKLTERDNIFGRFEWVRRIITNPDPYGNQLSPENGNEQLPGYAAMVQHSHVFGGSTVFVHHLSYFHSQTTRVPASDGFNPSNLGFNSNVLPAGNHLSFPNVTATRLSQIGPSGAYEFIPGTTIEYAASISHLAGKHSFKAGFDYRHYYLSIELPSLLTVTAASNFTGGPNPQAPIGTTGSGAADLLLGTGTVSSGYSPTTDYTHPYYAAYVGDTYRITPKLTVNYGLRYSIEPAEIEKNNMFIYLDLTTRNPVSDQVSSLGTLTGGPGFVGTNGIGRRVQIANKTNLDPRFGLTYQFDDKTVVRAGFGIFHAPTAPNLNASAGFAQATISNPAQPDGFTPQFNLSNPFPQGLIQPSGNSLGLRTSLGQSFSGPTRQQQTSYSEQWSLDVQRQLPGSFVLTVGYVGNNGLKLYVPTNFNQLPDGALSQGTQLLSLVANPFFGVITDPTSTLSKSTVQYGQLLRPHPQFLNINGTQIGVGQSSYHALQVSLEHRFADGLSLLTAYTHSKMMDNVGDALSGTSFQDNNCPSCDRSISPQDITDVLRVSGEYELPFGPGKPYLKSGPLSRIIGGWALGTLFSYDNGTPIAVTSPNLSNSFGGGTTMRPNATGVSTAVSGGRQIRNSGLYFNPAAFTQTPSFQFGNAPRFLADVRNPGGLNFDMLAQKSILLREPFSLNFKAEMFNAFNRVQFAGPNASIASSSFGQIFLNQANVPRDIQFSLRLNF